MVLYVDQPLLINVQHLVALFKDSWFPPDLVLNSSSCASVFLWTWFPLRISINSPVLLCTHVCLFSHPLRWSTGVLHLCGMQLSWSMWPLMMRTARSTPWPTMWLTGAMASRCSMAVPTGTSSLRGTVWWDSYYPYVAIRLWGPAVIWEVIFLKENFNLNVAFKVLKSNEFVI